MAFLPKDYSTPQSGGNYLKLKEGAIKFRIVSDALIGWEYWTEDKKPVRLKQAPKTKPADIRLNEDGSYTVKHFWAFSVLDRESGMVKVLEITQTGIMRQIEDLLSNADWGDPKGYDITITGKGDGLERRYTVQPSPHKELNKEEKSVVARTEINLNALFQGENPFDPKVEIAPVEDDVNPKDVPF